MSINWTAVGVILSGVLGLMTLCAMILIGWWQYKIKKKRRTLKKVKQPVKKEIIPRQDEKKGPEILFDDIIHIEHRSREIKKIFFNEGEIVNISAIEKNNRIFNFFLLTENDYHSYLNRHYFNKDYCIKGQINVLMNVKIPKDALWYIVLDCSMKKLERDVHLTVYKE